MPGSGVLNAGGFARVLSVSCGVVGMALASGRHPVPVHAVIGLGSRWSGPARSWTGPGRGRPVPAGFASRDEPAARYLRVPVWPTCCPLTASCRLGCASMTGRWRLAMDAAAFAVGASSME